MIHISDLKKSYFDFTLYTDDIILKKGEIVGLAGNNGAGKTTFLKLMLDLLQAEAGFVEIKGKRVSQGETWKTHTGAYLDEDFLIPYLRPVEYLALIKSLKKINEPDFEATLKETASFYGNLLNEKRYISELSKGNRQKTGILGALTGNPEILILDEPFSNLDPSSAVKLMEYLKRARTGNRVTVISSHNIHQLKEICTRYILLDDGKVHLDEYNTTKAVQELDAYFADQTVD